MIEFTWPVVAYAVIAVVLVFVLGYLVGDLRGSRTPVWAEPAPRPVPVPVPVVVPEVPVVVVEVVPVDETVTLPPEVGPLPVEDTTMLQALADEVDVLREDLARVVAQRDRARVRAAHQDELRRRYLRLLRVERARVAHILSAVMDPPRRPKKAALAAAVIELPRGRHLALVPPATAREWKETA